MNPKVKAYITSVIMLLIVSLVCYVGHMIFPKQINTDVIGPTFTFVLAIEYFTDKYAKK